MDCPSTSFSYYRHEHHARSQRSLCAQSPTLEGPPSYHSGHEAKFDVQVKVQRSFSFEELQSGSYFASLDESDLQFYRVYGQPVLIPSPDEPDGNFVVHGGYPTVDFSCESVQNLHTTRPSVFTCKSYTLQNPLGEGYRTTSEVARPAHDWPSVKQESTEGVTIYANPALPAIASQLYTMPEQDENDFVESSGQYVEEPPMDSLPFPPPSTSSPPYFQSPSLSQAGQDRVVLGSPSFVLDTSFQMSPRDQWDDASARASHMLNELPSPVSTGFSQTLTQQYPSSSGSRSHRRHTRSPSPRSPLRLSPVPSKRSLDKKPALACLFCRGRKIACGPPQPGSKDKTCNQCARRHLKCEYPSESRRGMRKRRSLALVPRTSSATPEISSPRANIVKTSRKRSVDKSS